jgi:hypothetical protein
MIELEFMNVDFCGLRFHRNPNKLDWALSDVIVAMLVYVPSFFLSGTNMAAIVFSFDSLGNDCKPIDPM